MHCNIALGVCFAAKHRRCFIKFNTAQCFLFLRNLAAFGCAAYKLVIQKKLSPAIQPVFLMTPTKVPGNNKDMAIAHISKSTQSQAQMADLATAASLSICLKAD